MFILSLLLALVAPGRRPALAGVDDLLAIARAVDVAPAIPHAGAGSAAIRRRGRHRTGRRGPTLRRGPVHVPESDRPARTRRLVPLRAPSRRTRHTGKIRAVLVLVVVLAVLVVAALVVAGLLVAGGAR